MDYDVKKLLTAMREANAKASNYEGHGNTGGQAGEEDEIVKLEAEK